MIIALLLSLAVVAAPFGEPAAQLSDDNVENGTAENENVIPVESDHYALIDIPIPDDLVLEVGGLLQLDDGRLLACTRRGDIWAVDNPLSAKPRWSLWADGLAEPLGMLSADSSDEILVIQRGELSALSDNNDDGRADNFRTVCDDWLISGSYHEYAFGPTRDGDGKLWVTLNRPFDNEPFGSVAWRGWAVTIDENGDMAPVSAGLRSPAGVATSPGGDVFYTDNQGEWCGATKLSLLSPGSFHGHPWGIESCELPESGVEHPGEIPDGTLMPLVAEHIDNFALPAVWFPYDVMGRSASGFCWDETDGAFGPFAGQIFVGDQYQASVMRVALEQVNGHWQGACFPFRKGLASGVIRVSFAQDGSLIAGASDRGWPSLGPSSFGLQRLVYTGVMPFEMLAIEALADGFAVRFTEPVDKDSASDPASWSARRFTYRLHSDYGSDETDPWDLDVVAVTVADDGLSAKLQVDGLATGYVHAISGAGVRNADGRSLLHDEGFYTLIERPGPELPMAVVIAADTTTRAAAQQLAELLEQDGASCQVIEPHQDPGSLRALRDAKLAVFLAGDFALDADQRAPLMTYADGGHGWVSVGPGLRPLAVGADGENLDESDPNNATDAAVNDEVSGADGDDSQNSASEDAAILTDLLILRDQPWPSAPGEQGVSEADPASSNGTATHFWRIGGDRQRILVGDLDLSESTSVSLLADASRWAAGRD